METRVGSGKHTYEVRDDWMRLPPEVDVLAASVTVDAHDNVYCFSRSKEHPVVVFDRDGNFVRSWGAGLFAFPHTIRADEDDNLWIVDRDHGQMMLFTTAGKLLRTIGTKGFRSDTGMPPERLMRKPRNATASGATSSRPTAVENVQAIHSSDGFAVGRCQRQNSTASVPPSAAAASAPTMSNAAPIALSGSWRPSVAIATPTTMLAISMAPNTSAGPGPR